MNLVPSGISLPFEVTFDGPSLPVAISVYDTTANPAVLVAGPAAMTNEVGNTYVGFFTAQPGRSYLVFKAVYLDGTFAALDPDYSQSSETIQGGGVDISYIVPSLGITSKSFVDLPQMRSTMRGWFQPMVFGIIAKSIKNFQAKEAVNLINFLGVWQPFSAAQLKLKPFAQRSWSWFMLHADPSLVLKNDDVVEYDGVQFRVMENNDYTRYGFYEYHLVQDYVGSGPNA